MKNDRQPDRGPAVPDQGGVLPGTPEGAPGKGPGVVPGTPQDAREMETPPPGTERSGPRG